MSRHSDSLKFLDQIRDAISRGDVLDWAKRHGSAEAFLANQDKKSRGPYGVLKPGPPAPEYDVGDRAYGAPPKKLKAVVRWLLAMFNSADLRKVIQDLQQQLDPPSRSGGLNGLTGAAQPLAEPSWR
jgi:hypothetical protein